MNVEMIKAVRENQPQYVHSHSPANHSVTPSEWAAFARAGTAIALTIVGLWPALPIYIIYEVYRAKRKHRT